MELLGAEMQTAQTAPAGHPLTNTTDQWTNLVLRRALRQAADSGAEYIAIPSGETVLSYNPGDAHGMASFYGSKGSEGIVPKNLRKILEKIDKKSAKPDYVDTLDSPSGATGLGHGFTLFRLTPEMRKQIIEGGMPMFASGGAVEPSSVPSLASAKLALERAVPRPGARDANEIMNRYKKD